MLLGGALPSRGRCRSKAMTPFPHPQVGPVFRRCSGREVDGRCYQGIHTSEHRLCCVSRTRSDPEPPGYDRGTRTRRMRVALRWRGSRPRRDTAVCSSALPAAGPRGEGTDLKTPGRYPGSGTPAGPACATVTATAGTPLPGVPALSVSSSSSARHRACSRSAAARRSRAREGAPVQVQREAAREHAVVRDVCGPGIWGWPRSHAPHRQDDDPQ